MVKVFFKFTLFILVGLFFILSFLFYGGVNLYQYNQTDYKREDHILPVDVIVCLAGAKGRIEYASEVWFEYWTRHQIYPNEKLPQLFISGMGEKSNWNIFLTFVPQHIQKVIQPHDVILETQSINTEDNAILFQPFAQKNNWKKILLITSNYHIKRSLLIFEKEGKGMYEVYPLALEHEPFTNNRWYLSLDGIRVTFLEFLKLFFYWFQAR